MDNYLPQFEAELKHLYDILIQVQLSHTCTIRQLMDLCRINHHIVNLQGLYFDYKSGTRGEEDPWDNEKVRLGHGRTCDQDPIYGMLISLEKSSSAKSSIKRIIWNINRVITLIVENESLFNALEIDKIKEDFLISENVKLVGMDRFSKEGQLTLERIAYARMIHQDIITGFRNLLQEILESYLSYWNGSNYENLELNNTTCQKTENEDSSNPGTSIVACEACPQEQVPQVAACEECPQEQVPPFKSLYPDNFFEDGKDVLDYIFLKVPDSSNKKYRIKRYLLYGESSEECKPSTLYFFSLLDHLTPKTNPKKAIYNKCLKEYFKKIGFEYNYYSSHKSTVKNNNEQLPDYDVFNKMLEKLK